MEFESSLFPLIAMKTVLDLSYSGVLIIDKNSKIIYINQFASDMLDIPLKDSINQINSEFFPYSALTKAMNNNELQMNRIETRNNKKIIVTRIPLKENDEIVGAIALFQDVQLFQNNELNIRNILFEKGLEAKYTFDDIIYKSAEIKNLIDVAKAYASTSSTVLITGESGTGKELFAQGIHNHSTRKNAPFVAINCATLPEAILESELFGYSEASFTGAKKGGKTGLFQQAHMGTIFLDEIGEIPLSVQAKLLRVLQERQVRPVGSNKVVAIDVRVIAATNRNLHEDVTKGSFRLDLLYRLNVLNLTIPPLRERREDIVAISHAFFTRKNPSLYKKNIDTIRTVIESVKKSDLNGNVRQLENILERLLILLETNILTGDIDAILKNVLDSQPSGNVSTVAAFTSNHSPDVKNIIDENEKRRIMDALIKVNGSRANACIELGISPATLWRKMKKYNIR